MTGEEEVSADTSATARKATTALAGQVSGERALASRARGTMPTAAKRRTTANFGVNVSEFTLGENARQTGQRQQRRTGRVRLHHRSGPVVARPPGEARKSQIQRHVGYVIVTADGLFFGLEWSVMSRPSGWLLPVLTLAVVIATEAIPTFTFRDSARLLR